MLRARLLVHSDHLRRPRRMMEPILSVVFTRSLPADNQFILVPEHISHPGKRSLHRMHVFKIVEVNEGFVVEGSARCNRLNDGADLSSRHNTTILLFKAFAQKP